MYFKTSTNIGGSLTNTAYERIALYSTVNLSDGHARHELSPAQKRIIQRAPEIFDAALKTPQAEVEDLFVSAQARLSNQGTDARKSSTNLSYSASSAMVIAAQLLKARNIESVQLIEPSFDNIRYILKTAGITVNHCPEHILSDLDYLKKWVKYGEPIWLVLPNNPTGFILDNGALREISKFAAENNSILIIDFCFRHFCDEYYEFNQYQVLEESGCSYICLEDTGKTWPLADIKVATTICSFDISADMKRLHEELLLNVSPFNLILLTKLIELSLNAGREATILKEIRRNRQIMNPVVEHALIQQKGSSPNNVPMLLLGLKSRITSQRLWELLRQHGIDILPAQNYWWSREGMGTSDFRIPLSRRRCDIEYSSSVIVEILNQVAASENL